MVFGTSITLLITVVGLVDRHGYCEAEVKGRVGLVPVSHLYPLAETSFHGMRAQGSHHHYKVGC